MVQGTRVSKLKRRLQNSHPQLVFHTSMRRNKSEIVFAEDLSAGTLAEQFVDTEEGESSDSNDELDEQFPVEWTHANISTDLLRAAIILRNEIKGAPPFQYQWPPTADDFNEEVFLKAVPPQLFNFLCWLLCLSDEPSSESLRESIADKDARKVDSVSSTGSNLHFI